MSDEDIFDKVLKPLATVLVVGGILFIICTIGGCMYKDSKMTPEEKAASSVQRQIEIQKDIANNTHQYEVVNVFQYVVPHTNKYGGLVYSEIVTGFNYVTSDGTIKTKDNYTGNIVISDKDMYVYCDSPYNNYRTLYLTKETMASMKTKNTNAE